MPGTFLEVKLGLNGLKGLNVFLAVKTMTITMTMTLTMTVHDHDHQPWLWPTGDFKIVMSGQFLVLLYQLSSNPSLIVEPRRILFHSSLCKQPANVYLSAGAWCRYDWHRQTRFCNISKTHNFRNWILDCQIRIWQSWIARVNPKAEIANLDGWHFSFFQDINFLNPITLN